MSIENGKNPHSVECGFYQIQYFSNIDIVNQSKLLVNVQGNYFKAYLQTRKGEHYEINLNVWVDLTRYYDSDKINLVVFFYPDGDMDESIAADPIIIAALSSDRSYYDVTIKYKGHLEKLYKTNTNPAYQNYRTSFKVYENCIIYAIGKTGNIISNEVFLALSEIDTSFTIPQINASTANATENVTATVINWGSSDIQEIEIIKL